MSGFCVPLKPDSTPLPQAFECEYDSGESSDKGTDDGRSESGGEYQSGTNSEINNCTWKQ